MQNIERKKTSVKWQAGVFLFVILIAADQAAKAEATSIFKNFLFAFSLPLPVWLMYAVYAAVLVLISWHVIKHCESFSVTHLLGWLLVFAGALENVVERLALGYVRDFIYIHLWRWVGIYNLADFYILAGILIVLLSGSKQLSGEPT